MTPPSIVYYCGQPVSDLSIEVIGWALTYAHEDFKVAEKRLRGGVPGFITDPAQRERLLEELKRQARDAEAMFEAVLKDYCDRRAQDLTSIFRHRLAEVDAILNRTQHAD